MDVFDLHQTVISEYEDYVTSFYAFNDQRIEEFVDSKLNEGILWPEPLIQLNPAFQVGGKISELVEKGILHKDCGEIFRFNKGNGHGSEAILYKHQTEAINIAARNENYVLTTGTGSGKSLSYIIPIVDYVLKNKGKPGIKAVVIYPMNALANSQKNELEKFLGDKNYGVTFQRYTGQENAEEKDAIRRQPPDILLTNYVMLELVLTRKDDENLINHMKGTLKFLVLDELHTYRGRQGADVSMLIRRLKNISNSEGVLCVGTSATMGGAGTWEDKRKTVANVASLLFGSKVKEDCIIGETLTRNTEEFDFGDKMNQNILAERIISNVSPNRYEGFIKDILASWIESSFGLDKEIPSGRIVRSTPRSMFTNKRRPESSKKGAADELSELTGTSPEKCSEAIKECLMAGSSIKNPTTGKSVFAFRLHQFISRGETVNATLENQEERSFALSWQQFAPGQESKKALMPLCFCRTCGQAYYQVYKVEDKEGIRFISRPFYEKDTSDEKKPGYLYLSSVSPWPENESEEFFERLPDEFHSKKGSEKIWPVSYTVNNQGLLSSNGIDVSFIHMPFRFCLNCGISYAPSQRGDYPKLAQLSSDGRSTATTVLSLSTVKWLRKLTPEGGISEEARKVLSFTDNRQDASLQAGHFNDFMGIGLLRSALFRAIEKEAEGLRYDMLANRVVEAMNLPISEYAKADPSGIIPPGMKRSINSAFSEVTLYRIFHDLKRGWRINMPNLEQCGLLRIEYMDLDFVCNNIEYWGGKHPLLANASPDARIYLCRTLLDYMRKRLAIEADCLIDVRQDEIRKRSWNNLIEPWAIGNEVMESATSVIRRGRDRDRDRFLDKNSRIIFMSERGDFAKFLSRPKQELEWTGKYNNNRLSQNDKKHLIEDIFNVLNSSNILQKSQVDTGLPGGEEGYRINAQSIIWKAGNGKTAERDPLIYPSKGKLDAKVNEFFVSYYKADSSTNGRVLAAEHTAQVPADVRIKREEAFKAGKLPVMFCSPTMELGVDISDLNVVGMRNVPPTPANYAQRSGRAGRSGQPALVITYCTTGSPHDQYFFRRAEDMVSGQVQAPRLELANEDLLRSHIHAIWLHETNISLGKNLNHVLNLSIDSPNFLNFKDEILEILHNDFYKRNTMKRVKEVFSLLQAELGSAFIFKEDWAENIVRMIEHSMYDATLRWRNMYKAAINQMEIQHRVQLDYSRSNNDRERAKDLYAQAVAQRDLLLYSESYEHSDFHSYRYFACEGFLPGYNFPRLPISAFVGYQQGSGRTYLSRPRFLAITEFGPQSIIYHEGTHYYVNRVMLPIDVNANQIKTFDIKICDVCGYINSNDNNCKRCNNALGAGTVIRNLFRMENVIAKRKERITADEEERERKGYDIRTAVSFADRHTSSLKSTVTYGTDALFELEYGPTASIWRINLGWKNRKRYEEYGYAISIEDGRWLKNQQQMEEEEKDEDDSLPELRKQIVVPFVEDRRNCLLIKPCFEISVQEMASLQAAFKVSVQTVYQLEDAELASEPLPSTTDRKYILLYEAAEGGAGILRQIVDDKRALIKVANKALEILHFDPDTGNDIKKAPNASEECVDACYDCLLSYSNQPDHQNLSRHKVKDILFKIKESKITYPVNTIDPDRKYHELNLLCTTELEKKWLRFIYERGYRLPTEAQFNIPICNTTPDFYYEIGASKTAIYIDGPAHELEQNKQHDEDVNNSLYDYGYFPLRFKHDDNWQKICNENPNIFGIQSEVQK